MRAAAVAAALLLSAGTLMAQAPGAARSALLDKVSRLSGPALRFPREKAYLQTDKPYYLPGDTLWFKAYVVDQTTLGATPRSGLLYVEAADATGVVVKRIMVPLILGTGRGYLALGADDYPAGYYTLHAYTSWMRNFGPGAAFTRLFSVRDYVSARWLIHAGFGRAAGASGRGEDSASILFTGISGRPVSYRDMEVSLADTGKLYHRDDLRTDVSGRLNFRFAVPRKADTRTLELLVKDKGPGAKSSLVRVPVITRGIEGGTLTFMPEGGELVAGLPCRVAFKALGPAGKGVAVSGTVVDDTGRVVARFSSQHLGMGSFQLTPVQGASYHAEVQLPRGGSLSFPLPPVPASAVALAVRDPPDADSLDIRVLRNAGGDGTPARYTLVGMARGIGCFGARVEVAAQGFQTVRVAKDIFPSGVATLMLLTDEMQPVSRRLVYIPGHDLLQASWHLTPYSEDSLRVGVTVTDPEGRPVEGSFSVAVTDDGGVAADPLSRGSMASELLLSSDVKGPVEDPGYYFAGPLTATVQRDLDDLLLTQGWAAYAPDTTREGQPRYPAETSFAVSGRVTNILNKPVKGSKVTLLATRPLMVRSSVSDSAGAFGFSDLYPVDTADYMLQATNRRDKHFNVGIAVDGFTPPLLTPPPGPRIPWYVNLDTLALARVRRQVAAQKEEDRIRGRHVLKEVVVVGQKVIQGSKNLNGPGGSDLALSESDMKKAGKMTLRQVLERDVKSFRLGGKRLNVYVMGTSLVHLIIDGVNLDFFRPEGESPKDYYDQYLDYLTAEDIKGIEVMTSSRYTGAYFQKFINPLSSPFEHVFIEITTYSGNGAFLKKTPGVYLYRPPVAFERPARFYRPPAGAGGAAAAPDRVRTVYWQPDLTTDSSGKASFRIRTNGPGHYTLIMEGGDMQGRILSAVEELSVGQ